MAEKIKHMDDVSVRVPTLMNIDPSEDDAGKNYLADAVHVAQTVSSPIKCHTANKEPVCTRYEGELTAKEGTLIADIIRCLQ